MPNQFGLNGANPGKQTKQAPLYTGRWSSGIWTNRSPLRDASTNRQTEKFYGPNGDALIAGSNVEITNKLTLGRRPGNDVYPQLPGNLGSFNFGSVDRFYDFRVFDASTEQITIMVDQANSLVSFKEGDVTLNHLWTKDPAANQSSMLSVGNTLYWADGVDNKKWLQTLFTWTANQTLDTDAYPFLSTFLIDYNGNIQQLTATVVPVTSTQSSQDVVTVSTPFNNLSSILSVGNQIILPSGMTVAAISGQTVTVTAITANTFQFQFIVADFAATTEVNKTATVFPGDGTPMTGATQPIWSTSVPTYLNNYAGGTTIDSSALWTNRGKPVQNWGIAPPTTVLTPQIQSTQNTWAANTVYGIAAVVIDTNGNLQQVVKAGLSASTIKWGTTLGGITYDGLITTGVQWKLIQSAGSLNWKANTTYYQGNFIVANSCLFEVQPSTAPYIMGNVSAYIFAGNSAQYGVFSEQYPLALSSSLASTTTLTGFNFTGTPQSSGASLQWDTINSSGTTIGETNPFPGFTQNYDMAIIATLQVPAPGNYTITNVHHDGCIMGIGGGAVTVTAPTPNNPGGQSVTAVGGYPLCGGTNVRYEAGGSATDNFVIYFPSAGTYPIEFNYSYWFHSGQQMHVTLNGNVIAFGGTGGSIPFGNPLSPGNSQGVQSGSTPPIWPPYTTANAPGYAQVSESNGRLTWSNIGPTTDFVWNSATHFTLPNTVVTDAGLYLQAPYRQGTSGTTAPFTLSSDVTSALTNDNPNLIWICDGKSTVSPTGTLTSVLGGYVYAISLVNTLDDTVSNATPISTTTGAFSGASGVYLSPGDGLPAVQNIDPQADYVAIWRSTDGQTTPFLIPGSNDYTLPVTLPLSTYLVSGYLDTTQDSGLNNLISAPVAGENTPPPTGATNLAYYLSRIFYSVGNTVYWTSGPDTPAGNGINGSAPANFDEQQSQVVRIVPQTSGALVFTISDINLISGNGTTNNPIQAATPYLQGVGLRSYNALDINVSEIGFFSTDSQFLILDPANGCSSAGFPLGDQFRLDNGTPGQSWNPNEVYVTWHVNGEDQAWYVADGANGWYRLMPTPSPESGFTWSPFATIVPGCKCVQSIETTPGVHNLLLGPVTSGRLLRRNLNNHQDNGVSYPANAVLGSCVLSQPGQVAFVTFVTTESVNVGTPLVLGVLIDEALPYYTGYFDLLKFWRNDPPNLRPSQSILGQRFYLDELENDAAMCRHMQIQINWAAENYQNEMLTLTIFGGFLQEE